MLGLAAWCTAPLSQENEKLLHWTSRIRVGKMFSLPLLGKMILTSNGMGTSSYVIASDRNIRFPSAEKYCPKRFFIYPSVRHRTTQNYTREHGKIGRQLVVFQWLLLYGGKTGNAPCRTSVSTVTVCLINTRNDNMESLCHNFSNTLIKSHVKNSAMS